ncbi:hypothetical protein [Clostridium fermenticellae]|nr:hypothetical protein [Clostridium fermenticellae]
MKHKHIKVIFACFIVIVIYIISDIFTHSTIERTIRADLFFKGYIVKAFKTKISKRPIPDPQYGTLYICNNPAIGPDSYKINMKYKYFGKIKYWYVNPAGTGGG